MKNIIMFFIIGTLLMCCVEKEDALSIPICDLAITDSVLYDYQGAPKVYDFSKTKNFLIYDHQADLIVIVTATGNILSKFKASGDSPDKCGSQLSNLAFLDDSTVVVQGMARTCFFDLTGRTVRTTKKKIPLALPLLGHAGRLKIIKGEKDTLLISSYISPLEMAEATAAQGNKDMIKALYKSKKQFTFFNLNSEAFDLRIGYPKDGLYGNSDFQYAGAPLPTFDLTGEKLFAIFSPDEYIYQYNLSGEEIGKIPCDFEKFTLRSPDPMGTQPKDAYKSIALNSTILGVHALQDQVLVTYNTGLTQDQYAEMNGLQDWVQVMDKYSTTYAVLYENGKKKYADIPLPKSCYDIAYVHAADMIIMYTNFNKNESKSQSKIYIGKLVPRPIKE
jgi:hypothetical protein